MSALLLALYSDCETAQRVRIDLIQDGFPTDRVDVTGCDDPGRASLEPAETLHNKFVQYFGSLLPQGGRVESAERLAERIDEGAAAVTVHPRGVVETERAREILSRSEPVELMPYDIGNQRMEWAASRGATPWVRHLMMENHSNAHCIYCRLFERDF
jgi:hypothetical protein